MKQLAAYNDSNSQTFALGASDYVDARVLGANTAEAFTKPAGAKFVRLSGTVQFYYKPNGTAAVPGADVTDGSASVVCPVSSTPLISVSDITSIGVISATAAVISAEWFA